MFYFAIAWGLAALAVALQSMGVDDLGWSLPLAASRCVLVLTGVKVARNSDGWADTLARRAWTEQGFQVPQPRASARLMGVGMVIIGVGFAAPAITTAV
jgi:hypothetical protein